MPPTPLLSFGTRGYGGGFGSRMPGASSSKGLWGGPAEIDWSAMSRSFSARALNWKGRSDPNLAALPPAVFAPQVQIRKPQLAALPVGEFAPHYDPAYEDVGDPPVSMEAPTYDVGPSSPLPDLRPVLPRPVGPGRHTVSTPTAWPEFEVEEFPEGDYPKGSIFAPGGAWGQPAEQHDLDATPEDQEMADWGWVGDIIDVFQGQVPGGGPITTQPYFPPGPGFAAPGAGIPGGYPASPPSRAPVLDRYGRPCRRRRRRRLLTSSDLKDLAALKTITGNNDALKMAVIKAVR